MHTRKIISDGAIFGGMAGLTSFIALVCIGYYLDLGSIQSSIDRLMP